MDWPLLAILFAVSSALTVAGLIRPGKIYEYPFLAGTTFLGFVLPQLPAYADDPFLPEGAFAKTVFFTILCVLACGAGWAAGKQPMRLFTWRFDEQRLLWVAALLVLAGAFFYFKLSRLPKEALAVTQWTGIATVYYFFSELLFYGWVIAVLCYVRRPRAFSLAIVLFGATLILDRVIFGGRRQVMVEFVLTVLIALWFQRRIAAPRMVALAAALGAGLALASTGDYRSVSTNDDASWSQLSKIHIIDNFIDLLQNGGQELLNAILRVDSTDRTQTFDFGAVHWNGLVFSFVPAQFLGQDFKESLMIPVVQDRDYDPEIGTTETGMTDAFVSFWYFGAVKFFLIAYLLGRMYRTAMAGSAAAQIFYMVSAASSMLVITHLTQVMIVGWVQAGIFMLPLLALARTKGSTTRPLERRAIHGNPE